MGIGGEIIQELAGIGYEIIQELAGKGGKIIQKLAGIGYEIIQELAGIGGEIIQEMASIGSDFSKLRYFKMHLNNIFIIGLGKVTKHNYYHNVNFPIIKMLTISQNAIFKD